MKITLTFVVFIGLCFTIQSCNETTAYKRFSYEYKTFSKDEVKSDLAEFHNYLKNTHPDLSYTADLAKLDSGISHIESQIVDGMSTTDVWNLFSHIHPILDDAHMGIKAPVDAFDSYKSQGGPGFPLSVEIKGNQIFVAKDPSQEDGFSKGDEIKTINGVRSDRIVKELRTRMRGESIDLSNFVMSRRFDTFYWSVYGGFESYDMTLSTTTGSTYSLNYSPAGNAGDDKSQSPATDQFEYSTLDNNIGYMKINTFDISYKEAFQSFLTTSFAKVFEDNISDLIIDIRMNGGGAHDLSDQLVSYIYDKKFTATSKVTARVAEENISLLPGAKLGDVLTVPYPQWIVPEKRESLFEGNVYVMISERTYSQSIAFTTVIQDFQLGTVVGEQTAGRANQTGQVKIKSLSNTGLKAYSPIYIFYRAKPTEGEKGISPDIPLKNDALNPNAMRNDLVKIIMDKRDNIST